MVSHCYTTGRGWNERYLSGRGLGVPGTFTHTHSGNRYFYRSKFSAIDRCLRAIKADFQGKNILDAAGGSGQFITYFLNRGARQVHVADFAQAALDQVAQKFKNNRNVSTQLIDLKDPNCHWPEQYDFTFAMEMIFLLEEDADLEQAVKNLGKAVKPGGFLIISDVFPIRAFEQGDYVKRRSKAQFERLLRQNGFRVLDYVRQTYIFNRRLFGPYQNIVERIAGPLLYWSDQIAINLGLRPPVDTPADVKYLIAKRNEVTSN